MKNLLNFSVRLLFRDSTVKSFQVFQQLNYILQLDSHLTTLMYGFKLTLYKETVVECDEMLCSAMIYDRECWGDGLHWKF